jgi:hypothetical protein
MFAPNLDLHWRFQFLSWFLVPSTGTFYLTLHNQTATSHLNTKKTFLLLLKILLCAFKKPVGVADVTFMHFKLSGHSVIPCSTSLKIFSYLQAINHRSHSFPASVFVCVFNLSVLQKGGRKRVWHALWMLCSVPPSEITFSIVHTVWVVYSSCYEYASLVCSTIESRWGEGIWGGNSQVLL